jgi:predicted dehydrogenase
MSPLTRRQFLAASAAAALTPTLRAAEGDIMNVGVIGHTGHGDYGHGLDVMWKLVPGTKVVAVADADPAGLEKERKKLGEVKVFADYRQMLAETKPELAAICPRHIGEHREMALAAIEAGVRGIYMEKPFCRNGAEAEELVAACEQKNVKLALGHRSRYHPGIAAAQKFVKEGGIGRLLEVRGRGKEDARGGALDLWVLGAHVVSIAPAFVGQLVGCSASLLLNGKPVTKADIKDGEEGVGPIGGNALHARFETESGAPFFFDSIAGAGTKEAGFGLQVIGTKGVIDIRGDQSPVAHLRSGNPFVPSTDAKAWVPITSAGVDQPEPIADVAKEVSSHATAGRDLVAAIRENRAPLCDARAGAAIIEAIMAVFESHRHGGALVTLPIGERQNPLSLL